MVNKFLLFLIVFSFTLTSCRKENDGNPITPNEVSYQLQRIQSNANFSPRDSGGEIVFNDSIWLFGGFEPNRTNEVWCSSDGINWIQKPNAPWTPRNLMSVVLFQGKIWIMGGYDAVQGPVNDIYSTVNGVDWILETSNAAWPPRAAFGLQSINNKLLVFGGIGTQLSHLNDVWESSDGINWQQLANAPWSERAMFASIKFHNEIYLIGGGVYNVDFVYNLDRNFNDVWKTQNGSSWHLVTANAGFRPRRFHNVFELDNTLFIGSGFSLDPRIFPDTLTGLLKSSLTPQQLAYYDQDKGRYYGNLNDIWKSDNGINWFKIHTTDTFSVRHEPFVVVKNDAAYWIGGFGVDLYNDVWKFRVIR